MTTNAALLGVLRSERSRQPPVRGNHALCFHDIGGGQRNTSTKDRPEIYCTIWTTNCFETAVARVSGRFDGATSGGFFFFAKVEQPFSRGVRRWRRRENDADGNRFLPHQQASVNPNLDVTCCGAAHAGDLPVLAHSIAATGFTPRPARFRILGTLVGRSLSAAVQPAFLKHIQSQGVAHDDHQIGEVAVRKKTVSAGSAAVTMFPRGLVRGRSGTTYGQARTRAACSSSGGASASLVGGGQLTIYRADQRHALLSPLRRTTASEIGNEPVHAQRFRCIQNSRPTDRHGDARAAFGRGGATGHVQGHLVIERIGRRLGQTLRSVDRGEGAPAATRFLSLPVPHIGPSGSTCWGHVGPGARGAKT